MRAGDARKNRCRPQALGLEHCAFGLCVAQPISDLKVIVLNRHAASWWVQYVDEGYLHTDSTVLHGRRTHTPLNWNDKVSGSAHWLWNEATCCFET